MQIIFWSPDLFNVVKALKKMDNTSAASVLKVKSNRFLESLSISDQLAVTSVFHNNKNTVLKARWT